MRLSYFLLHLSYENRLIYGLVYFYTPFYISVLFIVRFHIILYIIHIRS